MLAAHVHNSQAVQVVDKNKGRYAVLKGHWERDNVWPPTPVQVVPDNIHPNYRENLNICVLK